VGKPTRIAAAIHLVVYAESVQKPNVPFACSWKRATGELPAFYSTCKELKMKIGSHLFGTMAMKGK
jgi:hypothetical protein